MQLHCCNGWPVIWAERRVLLAVAMQVDVGHKQLTRFVAAMEGKWLFAFHRVCRQGLDSTGVIEQILLYRINLNKWGPVLLPLPS